METQLQVRMTKGAEGIMKILIIEDEEILGQLITELFSRANFDISLCHTGAEGLAMFKSQHYDAVLSDLCLPDINGLDVIQKMQNSDSNNDCQFHVMSGYFEDPLRQRDLNIVNYFAKPDDADPDHVVLLKFCYLSPKGKACCQTVRSTMASITFSTGSQTLRCINRAISAAPRV